MYVEKNPNLNQPKGTRLAALAKRVRVGDAIQIDLGHGEIEMWRRIDARSTRDGSIVEYDAALTALHRRIKANA
jgi:hypothetical protein